MPTLADAIASIFKWVHNQIVRTVVETPSFRRQADAIWTAAEREAFIDFIAANPDAGDIIPGADGARKVRWGRRGIGKRGGVRVVYFHLASDQVVLLIMVYAKAARENVDAKAVKRA